MAPNPSIVIVGAGIAGLVLAIILERAGMHRYIILERTPTLRPLGSHIALSAMMLRCFEQLGLLEEIIEVAKPSVGNVFFDEDMNYIGNLTSIFVGERFGYYNMVLTRPDLYAVLTKHLPTNKISFGKKVMSLVQDQNRATVMCSDRSVYHADIVIGADGTYSGIRQAMYAAIEKDAPVRAIHDVVKEQLRDLKQSEGGEGKTFGEGLKRMFRASTTNLNLNSGPPVTSADVQSVSTQNGGGIKVGKNKVMLPKSDIASLRFDHPAIVGVTEPLDTEKYPFLKDKCTQGITVLLKNGVSLWLFGVSSNRISFGVGGRALIDSNTQTTKENFKTSAWGTKDVDAIASRDWLRNIKLPFGGVFSDLLDKTPKDTVARIMMEDKFFKTWYHKRTVMVGDAVHKTIIYAGVGAVNAIIDCIVLMNCIYDMPDGDAFTHEDITRAFQAYYSIRAKAAAAAVKAARQTSDFMCSTSGLSFQIRKRAIRSMPDMFLHMTADRIFASRPILSFLPFVPDYGSRKSIPQMLGRRDREELEALRVRDRAAKMEEKRQKAERKKSLKDPRPLKRSSEATRLVTFGPDVATVGGSRSSLPVREVAPKDAQPSSTTNSTGGANGSGNIEILKNGAGRILKGATFGRSSVWPSLSRSFSQARPVLPARTLPTAAARTVPAAQSSELNPNRASILVAESLPDHNNLDETMAIHIQLRGVRDVGAIANSSFPSSSSSMPSFTVPRYPHANPDGQEVLVENAVPLPSSETLSQWTSSTSTSVTSALSFSSRYTMPYDDRDLEEYAKVYAGPTFVKNLRMLRAPFTSSLASLALQAVVPCTCDDNDLVQDTISACCECCRPSAPAVFGGISDRIKGRPRQILESSSIMNILDQYQPFRRDGQGTSQVASRENSTSETQFTYSGSSPNLSATAVGEFGRPGTGSSTPNANWPNWQHHQIQHRSPCDFALGQKRKVADGMARPDSTVIDAGIFSNDEGHSRIKAGQLCDHPQDLESLSDKDDPENPRQLLHGGYGGREYIDFKSILERDVAMKTLN